MTSSPEDEGDRSETIRQLETKVKHLANELRLVKEEHEETSDKYYELLSGMEEEVDERTKRIKELYAILELKGRELQVMVDASPGIFFYKDSEHKFIRVNRGFAELFEISIQEMIGRTFDEVFPQYENHILSDDSDVLREGEAVLGKEAILTSVRDKNR